MRYTTRNLFKLILRCKSDNLNAISNQLTYKILLSFFPFVIFLMTLIAFFDLDIKIILNELDGNVPKQIINIVNLFIDEVVTKKNISLLSSSLFISIWSASSGFEALIKNINKIYHQKETRNFIIVKLISIACVFIFAISIILCVVLLVLDNKILILLSQRALKFYNIYVVLLKYILTILLLTLFSNLIYKISVCYKTKIFYFLPGSIFCSVFWIIFSMAFSFYVNNFSRYSTIYGSIGSIFVLMIWLNLLINVLLIGLEVNRFYRSQDF